MKLKPNFPSKLLLTLPAGWTAIYTNTPSGGIFVFTNSNVANSQRFYRIIQY